MTGAKSPSPTDPQDVPDADPESVARAILLRKLTAAPATRSQLAALLARRGVPDDAATRVLDRFEEVSLVDDAAYADLWVRSRQSGRRGLARRALRHELSSRGVAPQVVADAVSSVSDDDERLAAAALVRRRASSMSNLDAAVRRRRLMGMLARKGYAAGLAAAVVREIEGEDDGASG